MHPADARQCTAMMIRKWLAKGCLRVLCLNNRLPIHAPGEPPMADSKSSLASLTRLRPRRDPDRDRNLS